MKSEIDYFNEFKSGACILFLVCRRGCNLSTATLGDIVFQKIQGEAAFMFWKSAAGAEAFILKHGQTAGFNVQSVNIDELSNAVMSIWGKQGMERFRYVLME